MFFALLSLLQALPVKLDNPVLLASLDRPGGLDFLDSPVLQDLLDSRANLDRQDLQERVALQVDREGLVDLVRYLYCCYELSQFVCCVVRRLITREKEQSVVVVG